MTILFLNEIFVEHNILTPLLNNRLVCLKFSRSLECRNTYRQYHHHHHPTRVFTEVLGIKCTCIQCFYIIYNILYMYTTRPRTLSTRDIITVEIVYNDTTAALIPLT